jgi:hypothetical protein
MLLSLISQSPHHRDLYHYPTYNHYLIIAIVPLSFYSTTTLITFITTLYYNHYHTPSLLLSFSPFVFIRNIAIIIIIIYHNYKDYHHFIIIVNFISLPTKYCKRFPIPKIFYIKRHLNECLCSI